MSYPLFMQRQVFLAVMARSSAHAPGGERAVSVAGGSVAKVWEWLRMTSTVMG